MKNKIHNYDFLIVGAGLIGSIAAYSLHKNKFKVLIIDKKKTIIADKRTLAVNANSKDFLSNLGLWNSFKSKPQPINKIIIKDYINSSPLIFENQYEPMGSVIFNNELLKLVRGKLVDAKILRTNLNLNLNSLRPNKNIFINKKNYLFKKIIISTGRDKDLDFNQKIIRFDQGHHSFVGFFNHDKNHQNQAYEIFNPEGPLAILPAPSNNKRKSTFIYSSKKHISFSNLKLLIKKNFRHTHGKLYFERSIYKFPISPHLRKHNENFIYTGDSLKSIHPVAGQGWNLGIKDIQKLIMLCNTYSLDDKVFNSIYYSNRFFESSIYFGFTSLLNFLYENRNPINKKIIKSGYLSLINLKFVRDLFIKQAMGRKNLI